MMPEALRHSSSTVFCVSRGYIRRKWEVELYNDVRSLLLALDRVGCKIAVASRTDEPEW